MKIADYIELKRKEGGFAMGPPFVLSKSEEDNKLITAISNHVRYGRTWEIGYDKTSFRLGYKDKFLLL